MDVEKKQESVIRSLKLDSEKFYDEFTKAARGLVDPEVLAKLRKLRILIAGCGGVGSPVAMTLARSGAWNITLMDPDTVDVSNLARQVYYLWQVGKNKAEMTAFNIRQINPFASLSVYNTGMTLENATKVIRDADIIIDALDIRALDMIWELHKISAQLNKPVLSCFNIAGSAMINVFRYDESRIAPLWGKLGEKIIQEFREIRTQYKKGEITEADYLDFIYDAFDGSIKPLQVPFEQLEELLRRGHNETRTYQVGTTSMLQSALVTETVRKILAKEKVRSVILLDIPSRVRKNNPSVFKRLSLLLRAYKKVKSRGNRVRKMVEDMGHIS